MKVLLTCIVCDHEEWGNSDKELLNKIIMWNHVKKAHASTAERIMRTYQTLPGGLYGSRAVAKPVAKYLV